MFKIFDTASSAMSAQSLRLNLISSNMANVDSISSSLDETYRSRQPVFGAMLNQLNPDDPAVGVRTLGVVVAQMESGALAQLSINWMTRSGRDGILGIGAGGGSNALWYEMVQVCGTRGEAYYMAGRGTFFMVYEKSASATGIPSEGPVEEGRFIRVETGDWTGHERCVSEWVKLVGGEPADIVTGGRAVRGTVEVAEAAYRAAESGRTVQLPIEPEE